MKQIFEFAKLLKPYRKFIAESIASGMLLSLLALPGPWFMKILVDSVYPNNDYSLLHFVILLTFGFSLFRSLMALLRGFFTLNIGLRMALDIRFRFYQHLQRLSFKFYDSRETGEILSRLRDADRSLSNTLDLVNRFVTNLLSLLIFPAVLLYINWKLALIGLVVLPLDVVIYTYVNRVVRRYSKLSAEKRAKVSAKNYESLSGIRTIQSLTLEEKIYHKLKKLVIEAQTLQIKLGLVRQGSGLIVGTLRALGTLLYTYYGWHQILAGNMSLGSFLAFTSYIGYLYNPIRQFVDMTQEIQVTLVHTNRFFEIYNLKPDIQDHPNARILSRDSVGDIAFHNVHFSYDGGEEILKGVDFQIKQGTTVALVGKSGVGKTTITSLIPRFYDPTSGYVSINGHDVRSFKLKSLRRQIGYILQEPFLFHGTIRENIACSRTHTSDDEVERAARLAHAHDFIIQLPQGYDTEVGERGVKLSQGQKQRVRLSSRTASRPSHSNLR